MRWDEHGSPVAGFRPDFWLPDPGLFVELTTPDQRLVTKKNGKVRRMRELYPEVRVTVLYQRDTLALLAKSALAWTLARARPPPDLPTGGHRPSTEDDVGAVGPGRSPLHRGPRRRWAPRWSPSAAGRCRCPTRDGTIAEHRACRQDAVAFDVSHLGTVRVEGADAFDRLQARSANDLRQDRPGPGPVHPPARRDDGSVVDDIIVWWLDDERVRRHAQRLEHRAGWSRPSAATTPPSTRAIIAVQGPDARAPPGRRSPPTPPPCPASGVTPFAWDGVPCVAAGTGYTGEDGVECAVPGRGRRGVLGRPLLGTGIAPAGLGARDTLRLEAGLPLHGHELGPGITPLQAGLGWVVGWDKGDFRGRAALEAERAAGVSAPPGRPGHRGPPAAARRVRPSLVGGDVGGHGDQRQLLAHARARDRPGPGRTPIDRQPRHRAAGRSPGGVDPFDATGSGPLRASPAGHWARPAVC